MLEQIDNEQVEDVVQLVEITNNVQTTSPPPTAAPIEPQVAANSVNEVAVEVQPLSDSGDAVDALTAPAATNADSDATGEPVVTATIPAALVTEGTEVSLSLQDSFQVQDPSSQSLKQLAMQAARRLPPPAQRLNRMPQNQQLMTRPPPRWIRGRQQKPRPTLTPKPMPMAMTTGGMSRWQKQMTTPLRTTLPMRRPPLRTQHQRPAIQQRNRHRW